MIITWCQFSSNGKTQHAEKHTVYAIKACSDWHVFIFSRRTENSWYTHLQITGRAVRCLQIHFCVIVFLCWVSDPLSSSDSAVSAYSQLSVMSRWQKNSTDIDYTAVYSRMLQFSACLWHVKYCVSFPNCSLTSEILPLLTPFFTMCFFDQS